MRLMFDFLIFMILWGAGCLCLGVRLDLPWWRILAGAVALSLAYRSEGFAAALVTVLGAPA